MQSQGSSGALTADNSVVAPFATLNLSYGAAVPLTTSIPQINYSGDVVTISPVASETVAGMGGTTTNGLGTYTFNYNSSGAASNTSNIAVISPATSSSTQYNTIVHITTETLPDGLQDTFYSNYAGQVVLTAEASTTGTRYTYNIYNGNGQLASTASASAISSASVNISTGLVSITYSTAGTPVTSYDYYTAADVSANPATNASAGAVLGYLKDTKMLDGSSQDEISSVDYKSQTVGSATIYYIADSTDYRNISVNGSGGETTSYSNTYYNGSFAVYSTVTTLPTITTAQNGPGSPTTDTQIFDADGNVVWESDPAGRISYDAYDIATGAVTMDIQDVTLNDYTLYNTSYGAAAPFTIPSSDGLMVATHYTVDDQGRTTEEISPNCNITYTVYNDSNHTTAIYPGWYQNSAGLFTTTGPVQVSHDDWSLGYTESYTYAYNASSSTTPNDNPSTPPALLSLTRDLTNTSGQVTEEDAYFNLNSVAYNGSNTYLGSLNTNYYATFYAYDTGGRQDRVQSATGTITRTVYDDLGEPTQTWIGAVLDGTADDASWPTAGNMVMVSQSSYDADGNTIETVDYPSNTSNGRATVNYYDFQDRLVATMTGAVESPDAIGSPVADTIGSDGVGGITGNDTFLTVYTLDNLGEETETQTYNAEGHNPNSDGSPSTGMQLTAESTASYDNQGNVFSNSVISVSPVNGSTGTSITSYSYYDADSNLIASIGPTGASTKYVYNGAGWLIITYSTDGGQLNNSANVSMGSSTAYAAAASVAGDIVLTQTQNLYDNDGNVIETVTKDRFGTDGTSGSYTGPLGNVSGGVLARVSYTASYYDAADRDIADVNVGTNGGAAFNRPNPSTVTAATITSLTDSSLSGSGSYVGDIVAIVGGAGAGERATVTGYNSSTHTLSFAPMIVSAQTDTGWTFTGDAGVAGNESGFTQYNNNAPVGTQVGFLQRVGQMSQQVNFSSSGSYDLSFYAAARTATSDDFEVLVDGAVIDTIHQDPSWAYYSITTPSFNVSAGTHTISFQGTDSEGDDRSVFLDNVQINDASGTTAQPPALADNGFESPAVGTGSWSDFSYDPATTPTGSKYILIGSGGLLSQTSYGPAGSVATTTDPKGIVASTSYDALGRAVKTIADYTDGVPTNSSNQTTTYTYDGDNHVRTMTAVMPTGQVSQTTTYVYGVTTANGSSLDDNDLLYETIYPDLTTGESNDGWTYYQGAGVAGNGSGFTGGNADAPEGVQVGFIQGNSSSISQVANFSAGTYTISFQASQRGSYDSSDQQIQVVVDGTVVNTLTPPDGGSYSLMTSDSFTVTAGLHTVMLRGYDPDELDITAFVDEVTINDATGTTATPPVLAEAGFESPVVGSGSWQDFEYDPPARDFYTYDALGEQSSYKDRAAVVHDYTYDQLGRLTEDQLQGFALFDETTGQLNYTYNDAGLLATADSYGPFGWGLNNQVQLTYDGFGNLLTDAQAHSGAVDGSTPTVSYSYDASHGDRLTGITYPDGPAVVDEYFSVLGSVLGRVDAIGVKSGHFGIVTDLQSYSYLGLNTPVTFGDANGFQLNYLGTLGSTSGDAGDQYSGLDRFGRVDDQKWLDGSGTAVDDTQYSYDADGNVLSANNTINTSHSSSYSYDGLNRLTGYSQGTLGSGSFSLDATGNQTSSTRNSVTTAHTNNAQNEITSVGGSTLQYDADGNLIVGADGSQYTYDTWGHLASVYNPTTGNYTYYTYDALGRRISEYQSSTGNTTDLYYSNRGQVVEEQQSGVITADYLWGPFYQNQLIVRIDHDPSTSGTSLNRWLYALQDANYDVTGLVGQISLGGGLYTSGVVERYSYDPDGNVTVMNASGGVIGTGMGASQYGWEYGFQGGWTDPTTGLINFGVRWLDPATGTWTQPDPAGPAGSGNNLYQAFGGNSVSNLDPSGMSIITTSTLPDATPPLSMVPAMPNFAPATRPGPSGFMQQFDSTPSGGNDPWSALFAAIFPPSQQTAPPISLITAGNATMPNMAGIVQLLLGNQAHKIITAAYFATHPNALILANRALVTILRWLLERGNKVDLDRLLTFTRLIRPDILNLDTGDLYEIKSEETGAAAARFEAILYILALALGGFSARLGTTNDVGIWGTAWTPDGTLIWYAPEHGVILYFYEGPDLLPAPVPAPVPISPTEYNPDQETDTKPNTNVPYSGPAFDFSLSPSGQRTLILGGKVVAAGASAWALVIIGGVIFAPVGG